MMTEERIEMKVLISALLLISGSAVSAFSQSPTPTAASDNEVVKIADSADLHGSEIIVLIDRFASIRPIRKIRVLCLLAITSAAE